MELLVRAPAPFHLPALALFALLVYAAFRYHVGQILATERTAWAAVKAEREHTALILDSITDGVVAIDRHWRVTYCNPVAQELVHRPRSELLGRDMRELLPGLESSVFYQNYERALHEQVPVHFEAASHLMAAWFEVHAYPSQEGLTVYFRDVTERHEHEEKLRSLSLLDELTGLYNRRGFLTLAHQHCKQAERKHRGLLLVFLDVDGLKLINDSLGHGAGDQALVAIGDALRQSFRESDVVARLGGDEFAALALETEPEAEPILLNRLWSYLDDFNREHPQGIPLSVSVGTAFFDANNPCSLDDLLDVADRAMYFQKREKAGREHS
jgi:diguanylate cyclase (GGDEF)-like protein/PAS domain S-box-containing protein